MGPHHKPRHDRLGGRRSGDLERHIYVSVCVWGVGVGGGSGGDGGELDWGGREGLRKERPSLYSTLEYSVKRLHICIHTLFCPGPLGNSANPPLE